MKLSNLSNKAKLAMAAGVGVLVVGTGVGLYATQFSSPKNVFLSRLQERTSAGKLTQDYEVALKTSGNTNNSMIDGISINGQSTLVLVTHDERLAHRCRRLIRLEAGLMVAPLEP